MNNSTPSLDPMRGSYSLFLESRPSGVTLLLFIGVAVLVGCGGDPEGVDWVDPADISTGGSTSTTGETTGATTGGTTGGPTGGGSTGQTSPSDPEGAALYAEQCGGCHGVSGQGGSGPALRAWTRGFEALRIEIDTTMPYGNPGACVGDCAERVARHILDAFAEPEEAVCDGGEEEVLPQRRLRLLTRREYARTVRDLFNPGAEPVDEGCRAQRFSFDPQGQSYDTVHVAGSFNDWAGTIAGGGWPMTWDQAAGRWVLERALEDGRYEYKFVINESDWRQDTANPEATSDGLGGFNSVLEVSCEGGGAVSLPGDVTSSFPVESRPEGYTFDNNAGAGQVTATHMTEFLGAAEAIAAGVVADTSALLPCSPSDGCARTFVEQFGRRAYRRPLEAAEVDRLTGLILAEGSFQDGLEVAIRVMLSSPNFLYRFEMGEPQGDGSWKLTGWEVATALSYTFWGTMPDEALFVAAERGALDTAAGVELQARRLLADPRSREMVGTFAVQWLGAEKILTVNKKADLFPDFDDATREALVEETRQFIAYVVFDGSQNYDELLTADYTLANRRLSDFYGLPQGASGESFERVPLDGARSGLLGHASVLGSYAHSDQTSPILRGLFVRQRLLCQDLGGPPPNAGGVPEVDPNATTRERFRQHTDDPFCYSCHRYIDDVGFGFEQFDPIGQVRAEENGLPIDHVGNMNDVEGLRTGTDAPYESLPELAGILAASRSAKACFVTQYYRFVLGQLESEQERCNLHRLYERFADTGFDIQELMIATTQTRTFTHRR